MSFGPGSPPRPPACLRHRQQGPAPARRRRGRGGGRREEETRVPRNQTSAHPLPADLQPLPLSWGLDSHLKQKPMLSLGACRRLVVALSATVRRRPIYYMQMQREHATPLPISQVHTHLTGQGTPNQGRSRSRSPRARALINRLAHSLHGATDRHTVQRRPCRGRLGAGARDLSRLRMSMVTTQCEPGVRTFVSARDDRPRLGLQAGRGCGAVGAACSSRASTVHMRSKVFETATSGG